MRTFNIAVIAVAIIALSPLYTMALEKQVIAGAGPSTKIVKSFIESFSQLPACEGITFEVPEKSAKHAGGIKCSNYNIFGRTGRPLNEKEAALNKRQIFLAKVPIAFVVSPETGVNKLSFEQLTKIYTREVTNWKEVGGSDLDIVLAGREPTEALFLELKKEYDVFNGIEFDVVMNKDNHIISFMRSDKASGAIAFGARPNFSDLNILQVEDFSAGVRLGLVYDSQNLDNELVRAAEAFAKSADWQKQVKQDGLIALY